MARIRAVNDVNRSASRNYSAGSSGSASSSSFCSAATASAGSIGRQCRRNRRRRRSPGSTATGRRPNAPIRLRAAILFASASFAIASPSTDAKKAARLSGRNSVRRADLRSDCGSSPNWTVPRGYPLPGQPAGLDWDRASGKRAAGEAGARTPLDRGEGLTAEGDREASPASWSAPAPSRRICGRTATISIWPGASPAGIDRSCWMAGTCRRPGGEVDLTLNDGVKLVARAPQPARAIGHDPDPEGSTRPRRPGLCRRAVLGRTPMACSTPT